MEYRDFTVCSSFHPFLKIRHVEQYLCAAWNDSGLKPKWGRRKEGNNCWRWAPEQMAMDQDEWGGCFHGVGDTWLLDKRVNTVGRWVWSYKFGGENLKFSSVGGVRLFLNMTLEEDDPQPVLPLLPRKWSWTTLNDTHRGSALPGGSSGRIFPSDTALQWPPPPQAEKSGQESSVLLDLLSADCSGFPPDGWGPLWWIQTPWEAVTQRNDSVKHKIHKLSLTMHIRLLHLELIYQFPMFCVLLKGKYLA